MTVLDSLNLSTAFLIAISFKLSKLDVSSSRRTIFAFDPREELRSLITYVEQNAPVIPGTLRENLQIGNANISDQECYDVLKEVNLSYLIDRSPEKLDMKIGESGTTLSGGERQRLALARSLFITSMIFSIYINSSAV